MTSSTLDGRAWEVRTFPAEDKVLAERVRGILAEAGPTSADEAIAVLKERLEPLHPDIEVRVRAPLADLGGTALYVFRDGRAISEPREASWIDEPTTARLVSDASGTYVAANDAASRLLGLPTAEILGQRAGTFTRIDTRLQDADALWRLLEESGKLHSRALTSDGRRVEFVTVKDGDGPGRHVTSLRELPPEDS
jgi:PAS domain-containing protein